MAIRLNIIELLHMKYIRYKWNRVKENEIWNIKYDSEYDSDQNGIPKQVHNSLIIIIVKQWIMVSKNNYWKLEVLLHGEIFVSVWFSSLHFCIAF